jgi:hypothetical protein
MSFNLQFKLVKSISCELRCASSSILVIPELISSSLKLRLSGRSAAHYLPQAQAFEFEAQLISSSP